MAMPATPMMTPASTANTNLWFVFMVSSLSLFLRSNLRYDHSAILIAYYADDKTEETKRRLVDSALTVFAELKDVQLCTSMWAVTEMVNILVSSKKMDRGVVAEIESQLTNEKRLQNLKIEFVDVSPQEDYDFEEFFYHVKQGILKYHSGVGDVIHSIIMKNNDITDI